MIGPHWSKGWIIENNHIHDAKCCGVSLGKDDTTGDNLATRYGRKSGHRYQLESVFMGVQEEMGEGVKRGTNYCSNYDKYSTPEEYIPQLRAAGEPHDLSCYAKTPQPVWIEENAYTGFATPFREEKGAISANGMTAQVEEENGKWVLTITAPESVTSASC